MHGTSNAYRHLKCRCDTCRQWNADYNRKRKQSIRAGTWQPRQKVGQCSGPDCDRQAKYRQPVPTCEGHHQQLGRGADLTPLRQYNEIADGAKRCAKCGETKALAAFNRQGKHWTSQCKACWSIINRANRYGMTFDDMAELLRQPCSVCGSWEYPRVDHCHETGKVRGMLCHHCNTALSHPMTPDRLRAMADYLERQ